jgi:TrmH family RNA methyltransferase
MTRKLISSRDNPLYKELKHLAGSSQARRHAGQTILDGVHLCQAYLQHVGLPLRCLVSTRDEVQPEVAALLVRCDAAQVPCTVLPDALYQSLSQVENGIGVLFIIATPAPPVSGVLDHNAVLLDNLQDPGNLGSILRSAAAAGIKSVYCSPGTAFAWSPKVLRSGMGAHFLLNIHENADLAALLGRLRIPVIATSSHATRTIYQADLRQAVCWLFGHEGQGVAPALLERASMTLAIPHPGAVESLNVAASAAVCFFEQVRQCSPPARSPASRKA